MNTEATLCQLTLASNQNNAVNRLVAMIGVKNFLTGTDFVQFGFKQFKGVKANHVKIRLQPNDEYEITFGKISNKQIPEYKAMGINVKSPVYEEVQKFNDLFGTELKYTFERFTGLALTL